MLTIEAAKAIMKAGLGRAELEFVTSITAPLFWIVRQPSGALKVRNGSCFFLDAGSGVFGVTAAHVIRQLQAAQSENPKMSCQLGSELSFELGGKNRLIAIHDEIDIATFQIGAAEIATINKASLTGHQKTWPPAPPQVDRGVYHCGFPGVSTIWLSPREVSFGAAPGAGVASSISPTDVSTLIERKNLLDVMGLGLPPSNFDFGGISGGPMLTVVEDKGLRSWRLAGVIYEGPNTSADPEEAIADLEIIRARRADFLLPNGQLDVRRWETQKPLRGPL